MERKHHLSHPYVVFLDGSQIQVVIDALVAFANQCEAEGDICKVAPTCDEVRETLHELREIDSEWIRQMMKQDGAFGRYKNRPQG